MSKADWAARILQDERFIEVMNELKELEIQKFRSTDYSDMELREQAYLRLRVLEDIEGYIQGLTNQKLIDAKRWKILQSVQGGSLYNYGNENMSDTESTTPEGSAQLDVNGAANAILGLMGTDDGSEQEQPEQRTESNDSDAESEEYEESEESEVEQEEADEPEEHQTFRVKAAGEERDVTLDELIKSYQLGTDYTKKSQAVAEERKAVEAERHAVQEAKQLRDTYAERLQYIEQALMQPQETENLEYLKETDPIGYAVKVAEMSQREKQLAQVRAERQQIAQQQEYDRQQQLRATVAQEAEKLVSALPAYADPVKGEAIRKEIRSYGKQAGFSDDELANVFDSRAVLTLYKAMQYDKLKASQPAIAKKVNDAPKAMKPGVSNPRDSGAEDIKKLKARARQSGKISDAAAAFERFL